jgi:photosystem II stability/assembly factor-like uncharacterized protein
MARRVNILVGTVGQGIMHSPDGGESWRRAGIEQGIHSDAVVRCLINDPARPEVIFAGTDKGLLRSDDAGHAWRRVESPLSDYCVWTVAIHPTDPAIVFAATGTPTPAAVFRSDDGGKTWQRLLVEVADSCEAVGVPRVTGIAFDPLLPSSVWVGIEVDGVRCSRDGGDTWMAMNGAIPNRDVHSVAVSAGPPSSVFVVVNNDVFISRDDGGAWHSMRAPEVFPLPYCRGIAIRPDRPNTLFLAIGDSTPGRTGMIMRSTDTGQTWASLTLPVQPNSAMWVLKIEPADPNLIFAASRYGYLYRSSDGGDSWTKLWREFSEISSVLWTPS